MRVLTVNPGSSSVKVHLVAGDDSVLAGFDVPIDAERGGDTFNDLLRRVIDDHGRPDAAACRVVHGGPSLTESVLVDQGVRSHVEAATVLAPLHNPVVLRALDLLGVTLPDVPTVACFDTAFHRTMPNAAARWALPPAWSDLGIRRRGFHGFAHRWAARRAAELLGAPVADLRLVTCHLGSGASLCAIAGGRSVDTTMGFTPTDGLVMASRAGAVDPGAVAYAIATLGLGAEDAHRALERDAGLYALTGSRDMRTVEQRAADGSTVDQEALAIHDHQLRRQLGAMVAVLGGVDAVVFSGGVGEGSARIRAVACETLAFAGLEIDPTRNRDHQPSHDGIFSGPASAIAAVVVAAREELELAREARRVVGA